MGVLCSFLKNSCSKGEVTVLSSLIISLASACGAPPHPDHLTNPVLTSYRPEINVRHTAFKRGSAYLERYCMLITFAAYLERNRPSGHTLSFRQWVASRPDIISARAHLFIFPSLVKCNDINTETASIVLALHTRAHLQPVGRLAPSYHLEMRPFIPK